MLPLRFAFGYQARTGKDTAVEYLIEHYGGKRLSFASAIYDIMSYAQKICGFKEEKDRKFLQIVGTEWGRDKDPNVWVNVVMRKILGESTNANIYISDLRFPNEMKALKDAGFILILITRDEKNRLENFKNDAGGSTVHASETALRGYEDQFHYKIENNGTLQEFYEKLDEIVRKEI